MPAAAPPPQAVSSLASHKLSLNSTSCSEVSVLPCTAVHCACAKPLCSTSSSSSSSYSTRLMATGVVHAEQQQV